MVDPAIAGVLYYYVQPRLGKVIDDPIGEVTVHGVGGIWGMIATGLAARSDYVDNVFEKTPHHGLINGDVRFTLCASCSSSCARHPSA